MRPYSQTIFMLLLNRLQSKPSTQYTLSFVYFVCFVSALDHVGPDLVIGVLDAIQPGSVKRTH
jgi:exportin-2 (importin alpha re-exporter)